MILLLILMGSSVYAMADTLYLEGVGPGNTSGNGAVYTYPYEFYINGSSALTALLCDDYNHAVSLNEQWSVTVNNMTAIMNGPTYMDAANGVAAISGTTNLTATQQAYADAAWILQNGNLNPNSLSSADAYANEAVWELFANTPSFGATDQTAINSLIANAQSHTSMLTVGQVETDFANVAFYTPNAGTQPSGDGPPQEFMGIVSTPEPTSLGLLGAGLVALGLFSRRRLMTMSN
jgi:hypothetical protein